MSSCIRPIAPITETDRRVQFTVKPTFLCNSSSCIVNIYYKVDDNAGVSSADATLELTDPTGEVNVLRYEPESDEAIEYDVSILGDDDSVWTEGTGLYVFSFTATGEHVDTAGEVEVSRDVFFFEDSYLITHSSSIIVDENNKNQVIDTVGIGSLDLEGDKYNSVYHVCDKGLMITGITYDEPLSVFGAQTDHPKELEVKGLRTNGNQVFAYSLNPGDVIELSPIELSEPIIIETSAEAGQTPYPQSSAVRWNLNFHLGCFL